MDNDHICMNMHEFKLFNFYMNMHTINYKFINSIYKIDFHDFHFYKTHN